jgi:AcrR family transcriptional regulator
MTLRQRVDRAQIVHIAVTLADEMGFEAVTLAAVAEKLGIRIPSLYHHVDGLPGLRSAVTLWAYQNLHTALQGAAVGKAGEDAVRAIANAYRAFGHAHPGIYTATLRAPSPDQPELQAAGQDIVNVVAQVLAHYSLEPTEMIHAVRALRSLMHGFVHLEISGGFKLAVDLDETFQRLIDLYLRGLKAS